MNGKKNNGIEWTKNNRNYTSSCNGSSNSNIRKSSHRCRIVCTIRSSRPLLQHNISSSNSSC